MDVSPGFDPHFAAELLVFLLLQCQSCILCFVDIQERTQNTVQDYSIIALSAGSFPVPR